MNEKELREFRERFRRGRDRLARSSRVFLIGLIIVTFVPFIISGALLLKARWYWSDLALQLEKRTDEFQKQNQEIQSGERKDGRDVKLGNLGADTPLWHVSPAGTGRAGVVPLRRACSTDGAWP